MNYISVELIITFVISGVGFLLALFIRGFYEKSQKRKFILVKLESYLIEWSNSIRQDDDLTKIFNVGIDFSNQILKEGLNEDKQKETKDKLEEILKHLFKEESKYQKYIEFLYKRFKNQPDAYDFDKKIIEQSMSHLMDGKNFLVDNEASYLPLEIAQNVICLKAEFYELSRLKMEQIMLVKSMNEYDFELVKSNAEVIVSKLFLIAIRYKNLRDYIFKNK